MTLEEHLQTLAKHEKSKNSNIITADEMADWPSGRLDKLIETGVLIPTHNATSIKCPGCDENCTVEPVVDILEDGQSYVHVLCRQEGTDVPIDPDSLKQWEIVSEKLKELGYWPEKPDDSYITFQEAADILGIKKSTVSKWSTKGRFKDNGYTGQSRRLLLSSVLLVKHEVEEKDIKKDARGLRRDAERIHD